VAPRSPSGSRRKARVSKADRRAGRAGKGREGLRILITEDHASTRLGIMQILGEEFEALAFGEASDAAETVAKLETGPWNLLILDLSLPGRGGLEVLREVRGRWPALPVLIYSAHREEEFALHSLRAGASGYLTKERAPEELCRAVRRLMKGETYLSDGCTRALVARARAGRSSLPHENLSTREIQVLRLIAEGRTGKAAALELGLSEKTISTYRARLMKKLQVQGTARLIRYALQEGLI
jgi:two-component system invasion response regulator UvrY